MANGFCPECDSEIKFKEAPRKGFEVSCRSCGANLKVIGESPIELDWADEDLDDDWDDDEDD
jgi:lysine biosynthesis protein LysW